MHLLVAAFLGHEPPAVQAPATAADDDGKPAEWLQGMGAIPASQAVRDAATREEVISAFERQLFGEVKDVRDL